MTSLSVGSLLDDNIWHDVVISRDKTDVVFSVDRVMIQGKLKGEFSRLNLNREVCSFIFYAKQISLCRKYILVLHWWCSEYTRRFSGCPEFYRMHGKSIL